ncbi:RagB/SusD family nutrient uptake outer membrane protein [uncultured Bacteroides sp.]|uniref:RagB/SusD family nutrient uptake outer membrane protein n=1 Tax=uncultured Bacteroides sp. TaxID=162156 RepID=UPI0025F9EBCF|nr:RagB/SusD family nutrient uptake outer membrane protein [uncultured Bacteroides sp.]
MKRITKNILLLSFLMGSMASCNVLDIEPLDSYNESNIFSDPALTAAYVTQNYTLPRTGWGQAALRFVCDESMNNFSWWSSWNINQGEMTPDQLGGLNTWNDYYKNIKNCNIFFNNISALDAMDEPTRNLLTGEMTFFRAYYYMDLVNRFGGVPLITRTFALDDAEMMVPRNSYEECVDFIVKEFQKAADLLPEKHTSKNFGRATKGAALAMKCRMLLYAASPLWNPSDDKAKWQAAADEAEKVMALGYRLDNDYKGLFLNPQSPEIIFQRLYTTEFGHWFDWENTPNGWNGYSATCVLQEMVDSYEMEDGTMPDPAKYTTATSDPWLNRDPRFYASVVCDGQPFRNGVVDFWVNEDGKTGGSDSEYGTDSWNYSKTHYTIRKFMNESLVNIWSDKGSQPWIFCRLAEVYLNYAEAKFHCGDEVTARKYVNLVRERARSGNPDILPDITETGDALLKRIQHERKIELAFEEHRFFDVRRWKIAEQTEKGAVHGMQITRMKDGTKRYKMNKVQDRNFVAPNHYLLPIPSDERRKNNLLEQNPGYSK